jgi:UDP-N-acetylmuramoyl-tripeptide--D-alanyl-D-alanine ligase
VSTPALIGAILIAVVWAAAAIQRTYRQARYFQIEEYMNLRYARWVLREPHRALPARPLVAVVVAALIAIFSDRVPDGFSLIPFAAMLIAGVVALVPLPEPPVKKGFVRTQRAQRLLRTAFALIVIVMGLAVYLGLTMTTTSLVTALIVGGAGAAAFYLAPAWLIAANVLMIPVEEMLRRRFIARARRVLADVHPKVIGITGSYGKTTTKNYLRDILNGRFKAYATPKSYNTMMGICIALNNDVAQDYSIDYFICEMGAYIRGEIQRICGLTPPDISIVIEVGPQHLERFGSLENIAIAKYEIIKALKPEGLGIFNWDNPYVRQMYERGHPHHRIAVSTEADPANLPADGPRFVAHDIEESLAGLRFNVTDAATGLTRHFQTPVVGRHNVLNILLATAVAVHEGMTLDDVARRVAQLQPAESRLVIQTDERGIVVINDAYSANPVGIKSSLAVLKMCRGRRVLITPGMVELGDLHHQENFKLGVLAAQVATDIVLVGPKQTQPIREGVESTTFPREQLQVVNHVSEAIAWYRAHLKAGDAVLLLNDLPDTY